MLFATGPGTRVQQSFNTPVSGSYITEKSGDIAVSAAVGLGGAKILSSTVQTLQKAAPKVKSVLFNGRKTNGTTTSVKGVAGQIDKKNLLSGQNEGTNLSNSVKGDLGEARAQAALKYADYESLPARLPGNRGMDHVFVKHGSNGEVVDVIVNESKYATKGGLPKLSKNVDKIQQLSNQWLDLQIGKLNGVHPETYQFLVKHKEKVRYKANVLDSRGVNKWYDYGKYEIRDDRIGSGKNAVRSILFQKK